MGASCTVPQRREWIGGPDLDGAPSCEDIEALFAAAMTEANAARQSYAMEMWTAASNELKAATSALAAVAQGGDMAPPGRRK